MIRKISTAILLFTGITLTLLSCQSREPAPSIKQREVTKRVGMVIGIKPEAIEEYKHLHADSNPGVRDLLTEANMENFSIFIHQFDDDKYYLFGYYEYTGDDYDKDMTELAKKERNIEWLKVCDPMQNPFEGENGWSIMEQVYYNK